MKFFLVIFILFLHNINFANANDCMDIIQNNINAIVTFEDANTKITNNTIKNSQSVELNCRKGYFLNDDIKQTSVKLSCDNGKLLVNGLDSKIPACKTILCSVPSMSTVMSNVKQTPSKPLQLGETFTYECKSGYAVFKNGKYYTSIEATCGAGSKITPTSEHKGNLIFTKFQDCERVCDVSEVVLNNNIDIKKSSALIGGKQEQITDVFLPLDSILTLRCKDDYEIQTVEKGVPITKTEYIYNCKEEKKQIYQCKPKKAQPLKSNPPTSNLKKGANIQSSCFVSSIIKMNSQIVGAIQSSSSGNNQGKVKDEFLNGDKVKMKCQEGYAFVDQNGKFATDFTISCNGDNGSWRDTKACIKVCNLEELKKKTTNVSSVELLKDNKIFNITSNKYVHKGDRIRVNCSQGATEDTSYEITNTAQTYYETTCLDGVNFSVGSSAPICNKKIPKCNNSDIIVIGDLENEKTKNEKTNAGGLPPFICRGDKADQQGLYFQNGGNNKDMGFEGIPICVYNKDTAKSQWSHKTFKCHIGCILEDKTPVKLGETLVRQNVNIEKQFGGYEEVLISPAGSFLGRDGKVIGEKLISTNNIHKLLFSGDEKSNINNIKNNLRSSNIDLLPIRSSIVKIRSSENIEENIGYLVNLTQDIYSCSSYTKIEKMTLIYKLWKYSAMFRTASACDSEDNDYHRLALVFIDYKGDTADCTNDNKNNIPASGLKNENNNACFNHLSSTYKKDSHTIKVKGYSNRDLMEKLKSLIPNDINNWVKCDGFSKMTVGNCDNYSTKPINAEYTALYYNDPKILLIEQFRNNHSKYRNTTDWQTNETLKCFDSFTFY